MVCSVFIGYLRPYAEERVSNYVRLCATPVLLFARSLKAGAKEMHIFQSSSLLEPLSLWPALVCLPNSFDTGLVSIHMRRQSRNFFVPLHFPSLMPSMQVSKPFSAMLAIRFFWCFFLVVLSSCQGELVARFAV